MINGSVSILIPTMFDSRYMIELCLKSIEKYTDTPDYTIIVCDAGVDQETHSYLSGLAAKNIIRLIKASDWQRPKDDLVGAVNTEYYMLMHDDTQVLRKGWISRRLELMDKNEKNAIVGTVVKNYQNTTRFFPLGLMVKTEVSRKLNLKWGKQPGHDTGSIAYEKFTSQNEYRYVPYKVSRDIRHFSDMTWPKYHTTASFPGLDKKLREREEKMSVIKGMLEREAY